MGRPVPRLTFLYLGSLPKFLLLALRSPIYLRKHLYAGSRIGSRCGRITMIVLHLHIELHPFLIEPRYCAADFFPQKKCEQSRNTPEAHFFCLEFSDY